VGAVVVAVLEVPLEVEEPYFRSEGGLSGKLLYVVKLCLELEMFGMYN